WLRCFLRLRDHWIRTEQQELRVAERHDAGAVHGASRGLARCRQRCRSVGVFRKPQRDALGRRKVSVAAAWDLGVPAAEEVADAAGERDQYQPAALERFLTPHPDAPETLPLTRTLLCLCPFK